PRVVEGVHAANRRSCGRMPCDEPEVAEQLRNGGGPLACDEAQGQAQVALVRQRSAVHSYAATDLRAIIQADLPDRHPILMPRDRDLAVELVPPGQHHGTGEGVPPIHELATLGGGLHPLTYTRADPGPGGVQHTREEFHGHTCGSRRYIATCSVASLITQPSYSIQACALKGSVSTP